MLEEDDYTSALSHIIARDFFPGVLQTEIQQEYLEALDSKDAGWISAAGRRLTQIMTPGPRGRKLRGRRGTSLQTPVNCRDDATPRAWKGSTPGSAIFTPQRSDSPNKKPEVDTDMSLGAFQEKYTSEDNESFYALLDKQNQKRAEKYSWMWAGNKIPSARQIAHRDRQRLLEEKSSLEVSENGKQLAKIESSDKRQAMPDTWSAGPRNAFMFDPESVEDTHQTVAQRKEEASLAPPKAVVYDNTRIQLGSPSKHEGRPHSPTLSTVKDAIAGQPHPSASEASFSGASTPRVNGYAFVDSEEPEIEPPPSISLDSSLLKPADSGSNPFKLKEGSRREALHHRMVDRISKGKRNEPKGKREDALRSVATPRFFSSPRIEKKGGLTPAAERLLGKVGGVKGGKTPVGIWDGKGRTPRRSGLRDMLTPKGSK